MTAALQGGEWSAACPGRTLPPGKTWYPFYRRLVWTGGKSRPHRDSIPDHPACSQSLYRLSYPAHSSKKRCNEMKDDEMGRAHVTYGQG